MKIKPNMDKATHSLRVIKGKVCKNCEYYRKAKHRICSGHCKLHYRTTAHLSTCYDFLKERKRYKFTYTRGDKCNE